MIPEDELARVALARHPAPHTVLGPHEEDGRFVVRALRPGARSLRIVAPSGETFAARPIHSAGLFEGETSSLLAHDYRVEAKYGDGRVVVAHDPYAFQIPTIGELDRHLFAEGKHEHVHEHLGAHPREIGGVSGTSFSVWAPSATGVRVIGDFNAWSGKEHAMRRLDGGIWELFVPGVGEGAKYKFELLTMRATIHKSDPFGRAMQLRPETASIVTRSHHAWGDDAWMERRRLAPSIGRRPMSIYEVHLPSWRKKAREPEPTDTPETPKTRWLSYRELADELVDYVADMGFTHVELLPVMEHPYDGSWGYQVSGYFAPTSRLGAPDELKELVDRFHQRGIGVLLDWVPAHFPKDAAALGRFDGTPLFEHGDPRRGEHKHWETFIFDYGKNEVRNFLVASALYWLEEFHVDGLRVDAVASMLYLDYSAGHDGDWLPNAYGGRENLEAVALLRDLNDRVHARFPGAIVAAEESTTWPGVTRPTYAGGLGFDLKWNMGWMHDTLEYFALDPIYRSFHHQLLTFGLMYAYSERFLLPLSHDEVVHLKRSLLGKMSGDPWRMRASLRALYAYMWCHPGKKLLFMGGEIGQTTEWSFAGELDWHLLDHPGHAGIRAFVRELNALYRATPALFELDDQPAGFRWIDANDAPQSVASFVRFPESKLERRRTGRHVVFVGNFTPIVRRGYRLGVPRACPYREVLNSDAEVYGGSNVGNLGLVAVEPVPSHGFAQSIVLTLPPIGALLLVPTEDDEPSAEEVAAEAEAIAKERAVREAALAEEERLARGEVRPNTEAPPPPEDGET
jgi:1,4-alpha-glucan branching enzyme